MDNIMKQIFLFGTIIGGGCSGFLWFLTCVPPKDSKSLIGQTQIMIQSDGTWKFISYTGLVMAAGIFLFSFVSLLATFC